MKFGVDIKPLYEELKEEFKKCSYSEKVTDILVELFAITNGFLESCSVIPLNSKVNDKEYFLFSYNKKKSRAINALLHKEGMEKQKTDCLMDSFWNNVRNSQIQKQNAHDITVAVYLAAISFCATVDLLNENDRQSSGTFFEKLIGHLYAKAFGIVPRNQLEVLNISTRATLPTDFIFDLGLNKAKFHVPVKTSTRERVLQAWSHQKVLDGVYGTGRFVGLLNCLAETKVGRKKMEVIEICLPDQWQIYQLFVAKLTRIYYLDIPEAYNKLNYVFPRIYVKEFGEFFHEIDELKA